MHLVSLFTVLMAADISARDAHTHHENESSSLHAKTGFYTAVKGLITLGDTFEHGEGATLEGRIGKGVGIELGYKFGYGFALESDWTFARNTVEETDCSDHASEEEESVHAHEAAHSGGCHYVESDAEYYTVSLDLVYLLHLTHNLGLFFKTGVEYETEQIEALDIKAYDTGMVYAFGAEYAIGNHAAFLMEYEGTTIEGPRGHSVFAGLAYHF